MNKSLLTCVLTYPWQGKGHDLTVEDVNFHMSYNKLVAAVVESAGGPEAWVAKTAGGMLNPEYWPFPIPEWPPKEEPKKPVPVEATQGTPGPFTVNEPAYIGRLEAQLDRIIKFLGA